MPDSISPLGGASDASQTARQITLMIADDTYLIREALAQIVSEAPRIQLVGSYGDRDTLLEAVAEAAPDVVITDIRMPPGHTDEGIQVACTLRTRHPEVAVVVLSQYADPAYLTALLQDGSAGRAYLLKERVSTPAQLLSTIETVVAGGSVVDPKVVEVLVQARTIAPSSPLSAL